jgi:Holliday junction resolvasome RuvABC endonuclease subunit
MAIKKLVLREDKFIAAAPDAAAAATEAAAAGVMRGNKRQITLTLSPALLPRIDAAADALGISRAAWISMTMTKALQD